MINRCIAINKNNKHCRAKVKDNKLFCCQSHMPINDEILTDGCYMCGENINKSNELLYFNCKHIVHKPCYIEWLEYSTYSTPICLICRDEIIKKQQIEIINVNKIKYSSKIIDTTHLANIDNIIKNSKDKKNS